MVLHMSGHILLTSIAEKGGIVRFRRAAGVSGELNRQTKVQ